MSEVKISSRLNRKLSSSEEAFVNSLKEHCGNDDNITNMFIYGSLIQPQSHVDEYSDLDIMIVQNNFRHIAFQEKGAFLLSSQTYRQGLYLEYLLCDGHIIDLAILSEKEWKKNWQILPEYEVNGKQSAYGKRSHTSVRQALRRFKMFLASEKLV